MKKSLYTQSFQNKSIFENFRNLFRKKDGTKDNQQDEQKDKLLIISEQKDKRTWFAPKDKKVEFQNKVMKINDKLNTISPNKSADDFNINHPTKLVPAFS